MALDVVTYDRTSESCLLWGLHSVAFLAEVSGSNRMVSSLILKTARTSQIFFLSDLAIAAHRTRIQTKTKDENSMRITMIVIYVPFGLRRYSVNNKFYEIINVFLRCYSLWFRVLLFSHPCALECSTPSSLMWWRLMRNHCVKHCPTALDTYTHLRWKSDLFQFQKICFGDGCLMRNGLSALWIGWTWIGQWALYSFSAFEKISFAKSVHAWMVQFIQLLVMKILADF